ncbi:hypothetical protein JYU34_009630 [Plutella xylostella]|uniref:Uncharacterized protein n=1 Tax=Plutella xylostella TaxID=51655 RepID=A0ABQ7QLA4_PLUXY|nr:hypothetical protein JYU34_009630 [Plutella xylostella]
MSSLCPMSTNSAVLGSGSEMEAAGRGWAKGATGKDSEATSVLAAEYFCLEPVVGRAANAHTRVAPDCVYTPTQEHFGTRLLHWN